MRENAEMRAEMRSVAQEKNGTPFMRGAKAPATEYWRRGSGIEPSYTALQAVASPLCHPAVDDASYRRVVLRAAV